MAKLISRPIRQIVELYQSVTVRGGGKTGEAKSGSRNVYYRWTINFNYPYVHVGVDGKLV